ncbi:hypothetical protein OPT61_g10524 [Boeremia exigua]|uniref:Uncharacterized protein n=1 Tax=Boeremia exigua TaxID=749465 RepID=A0ACC2HQ49_9PLEO|nr:hypothetical protein OPT61_g10524 [Boeremia exigua]
MGGLECRVEVLEHLRRWLAVFIVCFVQQPNALEGLAYIVPERNARQDHLHVLAAENPVDALKAFAAGEVDSGDVCEVNDDETHRLLFEVVIVDQRAQVLLNRDNRAKEKEAAELNDPNLASDLVQIAAIRSRASHGRLGNNAAVGPSDGWVAGALDYVANAGQNNAYKYTHNEVMDAHNQDDGYNGKILKLVALAECVPQRFLHKINAKQEDERANQADGNVSNHSWARDPDSTCCNSKQSAGHTAVAAVCNKHHAPELEVGIETEELDACLGLLKDPACVAGVLQVNVEDALYKHIEGGEDKYKEGGKNKRALDHSLHEHDGDGKNKRDGPEVPSVRGEEFLEGSEVVVQVALDAGRDLNTGDEQEKSHAANAADEDVAGKEADQSAEPETTQCEEDEAGKNGAQAVGGDGRGHDGFRGRALHAVHDGVCHVVEEGDDFDHLGPNAASERGQAKRDVQEESEEHGSECLRAAQRARQDGVLGVGFGVGQRPAQSAEVFTAGCERVLDTHGKALAGRTARARGLVVLGALLRVRGCTWEPRGGQQRRALGVLDNDARHARGSGSRAAGVLPAEEVEVRLLRAANDGHGRLDLAVLIDAGVARASRARGSRSGAGGPGSLRRPGRTRPAGRSARARRATSTAACR